MPIFNYQVRDDKGVALTGTVEAPNSTTASRLLRDRHWFVVNLKEKKAALDLSSVSQRFQHVSQSDVTNFTRQLATMVVAGLSLPDAIRILESQASNKQFVQMLSDIEHQIVGGGNLADALSKYPDSFSTIYVSLIRAGESSGNLDQVLVRLADNLEAQREFAGKIKGAMIYPVIIIIGMVGVVIVMMTVVMPKLTDLYQSFGISLPQSTQILIGIANFFIGYWWLVIVFLVGGVYTFRRWSKTAAGEYTIDSFVLKIPVVGGLIQKTLLVDFTRTLGLLIGSGIHILQAFAILRNSLGNVLYRNAIDEISKKVEKGFPLGEAFAQYPIFPRIVSQMMKVGEETGKLDDTLAKLSRYFQTESEQLVAGLTTAIEPIVMVILGVGVGFIVISVVTPIYNLTSQIK